MLSLINLKEMFTGLKTKLYRLKKIKIKNLKVKKGKEVNVN